MDRTYFAHSPAHGNPDQKHLLSKHLIDTGDRAAAFLEGVGCADFGRAAGLLHDLGKYTPAFQARLDGDTKRVDHSTAGAKAAIERYGNVPGKLLAYCIAGHHAGLANGSNGSKPMALDDRLASDVLPPDPMWEHEIELPDLTNPPIRPKDRDSAGFSAAFLVRMMFSALVDADYLDTEAWFTAPEEEGRLRGGHPPLSELLGRLDRHLRTLEADATPSPLNDLRKEILTHAQLKASESPGLFTLTVPTGGGKTLTSLSFALKHAVHHGLERVIYVIPFTSIIEQTAAVFRHALDDDNNADFVLEHHSAFVEARESPRESEGKLRLAMENWDVPIVVTTAVQFFESLFSNRPSRCRKLHNIASSVIVLDEAQTLPLKLLRPCVAAIDELARNWKASVLLCTATQPALAAEDGFKGGLEGLREIAPEPKRLYEKLRRTRIRRHCCPLDDTRLAEHLREAPQVLCIVNTRRHARELYETIRNADGACHLTTTMCPLHRQVVLKRVRKALSAGEPVRLVATSLIEAGVDVDFPVVWRAEAGLESVIQAAGRCNREGKRPVSDVHVFEPAAAEGRKPPPEVSQFADVGRGVLCRHDDPTSLEAIFDYFRDLYWVKESSLDAKRILDKLREQRTNLGFPFETIAREFRVIETDMLPVIIPYGGAAGDDTTVERLIRELEEGARVGVVGRQLQPFIVQIPPRARDALLSCGAAQAVRKEVYGDQFVRLCSMDLYRPCTGLTWDDPTLRSAESLMY